MDISEATIAIMQTLLQRPDAPIYTPDELADRAFQYANAVAKRILREKDEAMQARMSSVAAMAKTGFDKSLYQDMLDAAIYGLNTPKIRPILDPKTAALWSKPE